MHGAFTAAVDGVTYACREERRADQSAQGESIQNAANPRVIVPSRNLFSLIYHHGKLYHPRLILTIVFFPCFRSSAREPSGPQPVRLHHFIRQLWRINRGQQKPCLGPALRHVRAPTADVDARSTSV